MTDSRDQRADDSFDLFEVLRMFWRGRKLTLLVCAVFGAGGAAYAFLAQEWFRSDVVLVQAESSSLPGSLGQLGGLASLAGINLPTGGSASQTPLAVLRSRAFARKFIEDDQLTELVLSHEWSFENIFATEGGSRKPRDVRDAVDYFDKHVRAVNVDVKSGLITLTITWTDRALSARWANELVERANLELQSKALAEAERNIKYLQGQIAATNLPSLQQSIGKVLESEMQKLLMARGNDEFAFKVVDRAFEPRKRSSPQRSVVVLASVLIGLLFSFCLLILRRRMAQ